MSFLTVLRHIGFPLARPSNLEAVLVFQGLRDFVKGDWGGGCWGMLLSFSFAFFRSLFFSFHALPPFSLHLHSPSWSLLPHIPITYLHLFALRTTGHVRLHLGLPYCLQDYLPVPLGDCLWSTTLKIFRCRDLILGGIHPLPHCQEVIQMTCSKVSSW